MFSKSKFGIIDQRVYKMHLGSMNVILLYSDQWTVSTTNVGIFSEASSRIQIYL
jgi:hypothetical protein